MSDKFLITGTGRCGSGYIARVLTGAGIPTGHEEVFNPITLKALEQGQSEDLWWPDKRPGESSWLAAPYLPVYDSPLPTVHLVRNPIDVLDSLVGIGFLSMMGIHGDYERFATFHYASAMLESPWQKSKSRKEIIRRNTRFIIHWHRMLNDLPRIKIESLQDIFSFRELFDLIGHTPDGEELAFTFSKVSRKYNSRPRAKLRPEEVPATIRELSASLGYEPK